MNDCAVVGVGIVVLSCVWRIWPDLWRWLPRQLPDE
jgi:hypothetical protein